MTKVTQLVKSNQSVPGVVQLLEEILERAKAGEIRSIAIAGVTLARGSTTAWHHENDCFTLAGVVGSLNYRIQEAIDAD